MLAQVHAAIGAVAPIVGISIGRRDDKATWRIDFAPAATTAQRSAAVGVVAKFDAAAAEGKEQVEVAELAALADEVRSDMVFKDLSNASAAEIGAFVDSTFSEMNPDQRAVFKLLLRAAVLRLRV